MKCSNCSYECGNNNFCQNCGTPTNQNFQKDVQTSTSFVNDSSLNINQETLVMQQTQPANVQSVIEQVTKPVVESSVSRTVQPQTTQNQSVQQLTTTQQPIAQPIMQQPIQPIIQNTTIKKKNKLGLIVIIIILLLVIAGGIIFIGSKLNSSNKNEPTTTEKQEVAKTSKTFMVYIVGADLESKGAAATKDLIEMTENELGENVNLLVYTGGSSYWWNDIVKNTENAIYEVKKDELVKVKQYSTKNMLSPSTLTEFLDYVYDNYKTDSYNLILWDHGGGPIWGYGVDEINYTKAMSLEKIKTGISDSKILDDKKLDIIGFDACLMSSVEVASALSDVANYMVASQEIEPGDGWDYHFLSDINSKTTTEEIGKHIIDYYMDYYENSKNLGYTYEPDLTLSMIDLSKIDELEEKINSSFEGLDSNITINNYSKISQGVNKATKYAAGAGYDLIDLNGFIKNISKEYTSLSEITNLVDGAVVYKKGNMSGSSGLSIYFPNSKETSSLFLPMYQKLEFSNNYKTFINEYIKYKTGAALVSSKTTSLTPDVTSSNELSATLPEDLVNNFKSAYYIVYKKEGDNAYLPVLRSDDVSINENVISTKPNQKQLIVSSKDNTEKYTAMVIKDKEGEEFTKYKVISTLEKIGADNEEEVCAEDQYSTECLKAKLDFQLENVYLYYKVYNDGRTPELYDIKALNQDSELAAKISFDLSFWDYFCFMSSNYQLYDANGNLLDDWISNGTIRGYEFSIDEGYNISFEEWDKEHEYYYQFMVVDTQDNVHQLPLIKAN